MNQDPVKLESELIWRIQMKMRTNFSLTKAESFFVVKATKLSHIMLLTICSIWGIFGFSEIVQAAATIPFSSTFDCPESDQTSWGTTIADCPGWQGNGNWTTINGSRARISSLDNNPSGGGGRGFGQAVGDGSNNNGGGIVITFPAQSELWIRWYMRFPLGFSWNNGKPYYLKIVRLRGPTGANTDHIVQFRDWDNAYFGFVDQLGRYSNLGGSCGWTCIMGGSLGDGQWHSYEVHLKVGNPGILEGWIDGNQVFRHANIWVYASQGITSMSVYDNSTNPNNGTDQYVSYDDFAISNTGYIGPISGGGNTTTTTLTAPTNLRIAP